MSNEGLSSENKKNQRQQLGEGYQQPTISSENKKNQRQQLGEMVKNALNDVDKKLQYEIDNLQNKIKYGNLSEDKKQKLIKKWKNFIKNQPLALNQIFPMCQKTHS